MAALLKTHRTRQKERSASGPAYQDAGLVFCTATGGPLHPSNVRRDFYRLQKKAGVPQRGFHSLRHTKGTLDRLAGVDIGEIAANLGHTSSAFTAKTHAHVLPESQRAAAD